jgi:hypothetical protein
MMKAGVLQLLTIGFGERNGGRRLRIAECGLKDDGKRQTTMTKNETAKSHIDMFSRDP